MERIRKARKIKTKTKKNLSWEEVLDGQKEDEVTTKIEIKIIRKQNDKQNSLKE